MFTLPTLGAFALGLLSTPVMVTILNRMPDRAFCDYGETPEERHHAPRVTYHKQGWAAGLFMAVVFALLFVRFGFTLTWLFLCLHCVALTMISLSDLRFSIIPDELLIGAGVFADGAAVVRFAATPTLQTALSILFGALIGAGMIFILNLLGRLIYGDEEQGLLERLLHGRDALGMGDLKLLAVCGIACGHSGILIAALLGIFCAGIFFAVAMALKRMKADQFYPLGPFLVLGVCLTLCFRQYIDAAVAWYLSLLSF